MCGRWPATEDLHHRIVATCHVAGATLVLGSTQRLETVSAARCEQHGVGIARRPAGGGAVMVAPQAQVWMDFWVPRGDPLWEDDVVLSTRWLGKVWVRALGLLGVEGLWVHEGRSVETEWSGSVCFAGLGPGEVSVAGAKLVGICQRRTREGARFFTISTLSWDPSVVVRLLCLDQEAEERATCDLLGSATGLSEVMGARDRAWERRSMVEAVEREVLLCLP